MKRAYNPATVWALLDPQRRAELAAGKWPQLRYIYLEAMAALAEAEAAAAARAQA